VCRPHLGWAARGAIAGSDAHDDDEIVTANRKTADTAAELAAAEADAAAELAAAEADAAAAEAKARAAAARARAIRLRRLADSETGDVEVASPHVVADSDPHNGDPRDTAEGPSTEPDTSRRRWWRRPGRRIAAWFAVAIACALLATSGYLLWHHHGVTQQRARAADFAAAARQGVVNMTSLDFTKANDDIARILNSATGGFKDDFARRAADFTSVVEQSKVVTKGTVNATAVESMTDDSAVVLVSATSTVTNAAGAKEEPRSWRLSVTVSRDADQLKMSKVEFVP
jgi:Mce-associated membrane protein